MLNIIDWLSQMITFPQLSFFKYILAGVFLLVFVDAFIGLIISGVYSVFRGR